MSRKNKKKSLDNLKEIEIWQNSVGDSLVVFSNELEVGKTGILFPDLG